jgi:hypothetical protein
MHHYIHVEIETTKLEESEPEQESVIHDTPLENQGGHLSILSILFWINDAYVPCLCIS